jgi:hypothetical protein
MTRSLSRSLGLALAALPLALGGAAAQQPAPAGPAVQLGVTVTPDTVAVGDPFVVRVRIRAPRGAVVEFPLAPDSGSRVELIDPRAVQRGADSGAVDVTALYRAAAWDVGVRPLGLADAVVRVGTAERRVPLGGARVVVRSVLPADTAAPRDPKPPRALFEPEVPWWRRWLPYILAALALAALLAWLWRRRSRRAPDDAADALAEAEAGFARVERLGLLEAGERGRYVALVVEVLRDYLARRVVGAPVSLTSTELLDALRGSDAVPVARLGPLLAEADLVKFARMPITGERASAIAEAARTVVRETEAAVRRLEEERQAAEREAQRPPQVTTKRAAEPPGRAA